MPAKDKYSDPKLRDEIKEEVQQGDKGGAPGQWSARKAQFMAAEYKKRGGTYNTDPSEKEDTQKNLSKWTEEEWQTKEGSGNAKKKDGTQKRYLPKKAWENMDEKEKEETEEKKVKGSKKGKQFVGNTAKAKNARKNASKEQEDDDEEEEEEEQEQEEEEADGDAAEEGEEAGAEADESTKETNGKRKRGRPAASASSKKQKSNGEATGDKSSTKKSSSGGGKKTMGSKHDSSDPPAKQASASRLPKKGQTVTWKAMPGWVTGSVLEIVKTKKSVEGKEVKGSKEDPRVVLRSDGPSKKIAVHKPEAIYFD